MTEAVEQGGVCPTCQRRVPHARKPTSPKSRPVAYRVPGDDVDAHKETLGAAAEHVGVADQPFWQFKTVTLALALLLQDNELRGFGARS
jgi:hypothetical protein